MSSFAMRAVCKYGCRTQEGFIETKNGQDVVKCSVCGKAQYNAPKTETGRAVRTVATVHNGVKTSTRAVVLIRANGRCELCGKALCELHVDHLLPVKLAMEQGLTDLEINSEENLAAMCAECNLGKSTLPIPVRFVVALVLARLKRKPPEQGLFQ